MPTSTPTENSFAAAWAEWHAAHERHRAEPYGFLAVTHLHWLGAGPARLDGVPGTWSVEAIGPDGEIYQALFIGPDARERAEEYARLKYGLGAPPRRQSP